MFAAPNYAYFTVHGYSVYYYGIILAASILLGLIIADKIAVKKYFLFGIIPDISTAVIIGGIIGARLYYCILNFSVYFHYPAEIFALRQGGLSVHGALLGGVTALYMVSKKHNLNFLKLCDIFALALPIAQSVGRWGNFVNSEAFGKPCDLPWKLFVEQRFRPDEYFSVSYFHPAFLYEALADILIFLILYFIVMPKNKKNTGIIAAYYLILYSIVRILIETIRIDCIRYVWGIPFPTIISIILIAASAGFIMFYSKFSHRNGSGLRDDD